MVSVNPSVLNEFADIIRKKIGIIYTEQNYYQLETRLESACIHFEFVDINELYRNFQGSRRAVIEQYILDLATNNETSFFRDKKVFEAIKNTIFLPMIEQGKPISIWSAACSTGQEPFSLAMILDELKGKFPGLYFRISATDYSQRALAKASKSQYSQLEVQRGLSSLNLVKYFDQIESDDPNVSKIWQVKNILRDHINFSHFNLLEHWAVKGPFDLILCRNVLIYQKSEKRVEILSKMHDYLKPGGYLVLGCAESVPPEAELKTIQLPDARVYQRPAKITAKAS